MAENIKDKSENTKAKDANNLSENQELSLSKASVGAQNGSKESGPANSAPKYGIRVENVSSEKKPESNQNPLTNNEQANGGLKNESKINGNAALSNKSQKTTPFAKISQFSLDSNNKPSNKGFKKSGNSTNPAKANGAKDAAKLGAVYIIIAAVVGALIGSLSTYYLNFANGGISVSSEAITINSTDSVTSVTAAAAAAASSVVTISVTDASASDSGYSGYYSSYASSATGSGVIFSSDGYIITNNHVVTIDGSTNKVAIDVYFSNGTIKEATLVGGDPTADIAIIKVDGISGLTPIEFADISQLNVGDQAIAIGAPQGYENTVTAGVVSALNRAITLTSSAVQDENTYDYGDLNDLFEYWYQNYYSGSSYSSESIYLSVIQTDASINSGNSGGALVDKDGKLIGINVAIAVATDSYGSASSSGSIGIGFAIPSDLVRRVATEIIETGTATHGQIGASVSSTTSDEGISGVLINEVNEGQAADKAGLKANDIVTSINGIRVTSSTLLIALIRSAAAYSVLDLEIIRDGKTQTISVTVDKAS